MPVSSNTLFHFTNRIDNLLSILEREFKPHYSLEDCNLLFPGPGTDELRIAIPMVSFCDLPLSQTSEHLSVYGYYGIGMTKEWGKRNGISPVLYIYPESIFAISLRELFRKYRIFKVTDEIYDVFRFLKPYRGILYRNIDGIKEKEVLFYNEREWRYVPKEFRKAIERSEYYDNEKRNMHNLEVANSHTISFVPDDISYLIVQKESEILPLIKEVERIKGKYSHDQVKILTTRIITSDRISEDF